MDTNRLQTSERIFALDALRSVMMLLGIVLHGSLTYMVTPNAMWPLKDPENSLFFDLLSGLIHSFRMPVFFVVSGFFCALLLHKKGPSGMLVNRLKRIALPLLAGVLIIDPLQTLAIAFSTAKLAHAASPLQAALNAVAAGTFYPFPPGHLWFLYFLTLYAIISWGLASIFRLSTAFTTSVNRLAAGILRHVWLRTICVGGLFFLCLCWQRSPYLQTCFDWRIDPAVFVTYLLFFGIGRAIYTSGSLADLVRYPIAQLAAAMLFLFAQLAIVSPQTEGLRLLRIALSALDGTLFVFGFIALFMRYFNQYSPRLSYLMDAAYWIYIIHLTIIMCTVGLLFDYPLPAIAKFGITFSVTCLITLVSYQYLVRNTVIGLFLNGKVYKKPAKPILNSQ